MIGVDGIAKFKSKNLTILFNKFNKIVLFLIVSGKIS